MQPCAEVRLFVFDRIKEGGGRGERGHLAAAIRGGELHCSGTARIEAHPSASSVKIACTFTKSPTRAGAFPSAASTGSEASGVSSRSGIG